MPCGNGFRIWNVTTPGSPVDVVRLKTIAGQHHYKEKKNLEPIRLVRLAYAVY